MASGQRAGVAHGGDEVIIPHASELHNLKPQSARRNAAEATEMKLTVSDETFYSVPDLSSQRPLRNLSERSAV